MPTVYHWYLAPEVGAGGPVASGSGIGTGADGGEPYAFARRMDPATRDAVFDPARRTWASGAPLMERVLRCLTTEVGTAMRDLGYGAEWWRLDNAASNASAIARQVVTAALKRFTDAGELVELRVSATVFDIGGDKGLDLRVQFADSRGQRFTLLGKPRR